MKQLTGTSFNKWLYPKPDGSTDAIVECVLLVSDVSYRMEAGEMQRQNTHETLRFIASPEALRKTARRFLDMAEQAELTQSSYKYTEKVE